jgi:hypothetical protein
MCTDCETSYYNLLKESFEDLIVPTMKKELRKASNKVIPVFSYFIILIPVLIYQEPNRRFETHPGYHIRVIFM